MTRAKFEKTIGSYQSTSTGIDGTVLYWCKSWPHGPVARYYKKEKYGVILRQQQPNK